MRNIHRDTAKIYQFPLRPRRRLENGLTTPQPSKDVVFSVVDTCWYHDEAMREEVQPQDKPKPC